MEPKRILLAENEPETARFIESELQNLGLIVETVADSNEAWSLLFIKEYAFLICDENMQGILFSELGKRIRYEPNLNDLFVISIVNQIPVLQIEQAMMYADITLERNRLSELGTLIQKALNVKEKYMV